MFRRVLFTGIFLFVVSATVANGDTILVPGDYDTIAEGVAAASWGDIVEIAPGTYFEQDIIINKHILVIGNPADPSQVIIDAGGLGRCFEISASGLNEEDIHLKGLTFTGGWSTGNGGAILASIFESILKFTNCVFRHNHASNGGAISVNTSNAEYWDGGCGFLYCTFEYNISTGNGGAIHSYGGPLSACRIENCTFIRNEADLGGGHYADTVGFKILDSTFDSNHARAGGGSYATGGVSWWSLNSTVANCTFTHNEAEEYGGGLGYSELVRNLDIVSNDFSYNHSDQGGGAICIRHSDYWEVLSLENSFYGNSVSLESGEGGGAILCNESRLLIMNPGQEPYDRDVFHWNTAAIGGAISVQGGSSVYIDYSTFRYNEAIYSGHGASGYGGAISVRDDSHLNLNHSVFLSNFGQHCSALECNFGAAATISHCTFAANRNDCFQVQASTMLFTSCIIAFTIDGSAFSCFQNSDINLYCTNIFGNQYYNWGYWCVSNYEGINGNMSLDPLFCGETIDTFESLFLRSDSPCADVPDCGLVGALPVNCGPVVTRSLSWSELKLAY